jgi:thiol:disulfide interchange protein DsbD
MGAVSADRQAVRCAAARGALLYISQTRDVVHGGVALFHGLGNGTPLLLIGATGGAVLPKSGPWMESVSRCSGS